MSGSLFRARAGRALLASGAASAVGTAAVFAFQGNVRQSPAAPARPAAANDSIAGGNALRALPPNAPLPGGVVNLAIFLDTTFVGYARSVDGCTMAFDVVETTVKGVQKELSTAPHVEPCVLEHTFVSADFQSWIIDQVNYNAISNPDTLGILGIDGNGMGVAAIRVKRPLLVGFDVPAADASKPGYSYFDSTIDGTLIQAVNPSMYPVPHGLGLKGLLPANFQLSISGVPVPGATQVSGIDLNRSDLDRNNPGPWDVSNIDVQTTMSRQGPFPKWFASELYETGIPERTLSLVFNSITLVPQFEIDLDGVGIYRADSGLQGTRRTFSLYAETPVVVFP